MGARRVAIIPLLLSGTNDDKLGLIFLHGVYGEPAAVWFIWNLNKFEPGEGRESN